LSDDAKVTVDFSGRLTFIYLGAFEEEINFDIFVS